MVNVRGMSDSDDIELSVSDLYLQEKKRETSSDDDKLNIYIDKKKEVRFRGESPESSECSIIAEIDSRIRFDHSKDPDISHIPTMLNNIPDGTKSEMKTSSSCIIL